MKKHLFIVLIWTTLVTQCAPDKNKIEKNKQDRLQVKVVMEFSVEDAKAKDEEPYQFSYIRDVDCDNDGNIYVLDHKDVCVEVLDKNGGFLRKILSQGKGPNEIISLLRLKVNKFRDSLFVLHEKGLTCPLISIQYMLD